MTVVSQGDPTGYGITIPRGDLSMAFGEKCIYAAAIEDGGDLFETCTVLLIPWETVKRAMLEDPFFASRMIRACGRTVPRNAHRLTVPIDLPPDDDEPPEPLTG